MTTRLLLPSIVVVSALLGFTVASTASVADASLEAGQVRANGITIAYESFGPTDGETLLLIAGTGMQLTGWPDELIDRLVERGYRVIRYDNRNAGLSSTFEQAGWPDFEAIFRALEAGEPLPLEYTIDDMAADAVGLLDAFGIAKAHIVGISMGGTIAQLVAADYPERTLSLTSLMAESGNPALPVAADPETLAAIPTLLPGISEEAYVERRIKTEQVLGSPAYPTDAKTLRARVLRDRARALSPAGEARQGAAVLAAHYLDRTAKLNSIGVPTVVVHGAKDPLVPVASGRDVAAKIPGAEFRIIPGMGHDIPLELVPVVASAIISAASRVTESP